MNTTTVRVHPKIWIVVRPGGEKHLLEKEPLEGIDKWAEGQDVTVLEYAFSVRRHPKPKTTPARP